MQQVSNKELVFVTSRTKSTGSEVNKETALNYTF